MQFTGGVSLDVVYSPAYLPSTFIIYISNVIAVLLSIYPDFTVSGAQPDNASISGFLYNIVVKEPYMSNLAQFLQLCNRDKKAS